MTFSHAELSRIKEILSPEAKHFDSSSKKLFHFLKEKQFGIGKEREDRIISELLDDTDLLRFLSSIEVVSAGAGAGAGSSSTAPHATTENSKVSQIKKIYNIALRLFQRDQALAEFISKTSYPQNIFYEILELLNEREDFFIPETSHNLKKLVDYFEAKERSPGSTPKFSKEFRKQQEWLLSTPTAKSFPTDGMALVSAPEFISSRAIIAENIAVISDGHLLVDLSGMADFEGRIIDKTKEEVSKLVGLSINETTPDKIYCLEINNFKNLFVCYDLKQERERVISFNTILSEIFYKSYIKKKFLGIDTSFAEAVTDIFANYQFHPDVIAKITQELNNKYRAIFTKTLERGSGFGLQYLTNDYNLIKLMHDTDLNVVGFIFFGERALVDSGLTINLANNVFSISREGMKPGLLALDFSGISFEETRPRKPSERSINFSITDPFYANISFPRLKQYLAEQRNLYLAKAVDLFIGDLKGMINKNLNLPQKFSFPFTGKDFVAMPSVNVSCQIIISPSSKKLAQELSAQNFGSIKFNFEEPSSFFINITGDILDRGDLALLKTFFEEKDLALKALREASMARSVDDLAAAIGELEEDTSKPASSKPKKAKGVKKEVKQAVTSAAPTSTQQKKVVAAPSPTAAAPPPKKAVASAAPSTKPKTPTKPPVEEPAPTLNITKLKKDLDGSFKKRMTSFRDILGDGLANIEVIATPETLLIRFENSINLDLSNDTAGDDDVITEFELPGNNLLIKLNLNSSSLEEIKAKIFEFIRAQILNRRLEAATRAASAAAEDSTSGVPTPKDLSPAALALDLELATLLRNRNAIDRSLLCNPSKLNEAFSLTPQLTAFLDCLSSRASVKLHGSLLHSNFPQDIDISVTLPAIKSNTEDGINDFFGVNMPRGEFAKPTVEQKAAILPKLAIPEELQDDLEICIQGGYHNSFLKIRIGNKIDISCNNSLETVAWTSSFDGMMLDWQTRNLVPKSGFTPSEDFQINRLAYRTHFCAIYAAFPQTLDKIMPQDKINELATCLVSDLLSRELGETSNRMELAENLRDDFIDKCHMNPQREAHFKFNFALILKSLTEDQLKVFGSSANKRITEIFEESREGLAVEKAKGSRLDGVRLDGGGVCTA